MSVTQSHRSPGARVVALPTPALDDAALVQAAASGDGRAARVIWDRHSPAVRATLRRIMGPQADVEDLLQEVFLRLFRQVGALREASALRAFLLGIAVRVVGSELRRRRVRRFLRLTDSGTLPEVEQGPADHGARQSLDRLYEMLENLSPESRTIFALRYFEGLQVNEIASTLGVSLATAKRRLAKVTAHILTLVRRDEKLHGYLLSNLPAAAVAGGEP